MISEKNVERTKTLINKSSGKPIFVMAQNVEYNRKILEYGKFDVLISVEQSSDIMKDNLRNVNSGWNHVLAKIAAKNNVAIGIDLDSLRKMQKKRKAEILKRIIQNIKFCRKAKCRIYLINCKDGKNGIDFMLSLGASTKQAKESLAEQQIFNLSKPLA